MVAMISCNQDKKNKLMENDLSNNPFLKESTLPYFAPDFTQIKNKHFKPALLEAMKQQSDSVNDIIKKQLEVLFRLGNVGRFVAIDLLEKISAMGSILSSNFANMTDEETKKYKQFLESELEKIQEKDVKKKGKEIKIE